MITNHSFMFIILKNNFIIKFYVLCSRSLFFVLYLNDVTTSLYCLKNENTKNENQLMWLYLNHQILRKMKILKNLQNFMSPHFKRAESVDILLDVIQRYSILRFTRDLYENYPFNILADCDIEFLSRCLVKDIRL